MVIYWTKLPDRGRIFNCLGAEQFGIADFCHPYQSHDRGQTKHRPVIVARSCRDGKEMPRGSSSLERPAPPLRRVPSSPITEMASAIGGGYGRIWTWPAWPSSLGAGICSDVIGTLPSGIFDSRVSPR